MAARILLTTFDCRDAGSIASFWAIALGYEVHEEASNPPSEIELRDPEGTGHPLYFVNVKPGPPKGRPQQGRKKRQT
jgi:Glyoxalase-like domain